MDKDKLSEVFEEVLKRWEDAECTVINDRSISMEEDYNELEKDVEDCRKRFYEALKEFE